MGTATHCPYCALQCGMSLVGPDADGGFVVQPRDFPTNGGGLCQKGWTAAELLRTPDRLTTPLVRDRKGGPLRPASWADALDRAVAEIQRIRAEHGPDAVAVFGGGGLTNEKAYLLGKFARVALGTSVIDYNGRFCMSSAAAAGIRAFGADRGLPFPLPDLAWAGAILLAGGNPAETMPPLMRHIAAMRRCGGVFIVADPRRTVTAAAADLHLQLTPGTDLALANGLLHLAMRAGHVDERFIAERTTGWPAVREELARYWPERVEQLTGVPVPLLHRTVQALTEAGNAYVLTARGAEQHSKGTDTVSALINFALALGLPGRVGSGFGAITGQGNGQGGREHGQKADQLPGYRRLDDPAARAHVAGVWGVDPDTLPGPGPSAYELLDSLGTPGGPRALLLFGSNPAVSAPHAARIRQRLAATQFVLVADFVPSETCQLADVILPTAQWAEEDGTMTNLEGRVIRRRRATAPPRDVRTDLEIFSALAAGLGHASGFPTQPRTAFDELRRASAGGVADYSGIDYDRIDEDIDTFWPCAEGSAVSTSRLFLDRFHTSDGRARFVRVSHRPAAEDLDDDYPVYLTTGRQLAHYQSGAQTRRIPTLTATAGAPYVELHPQLAVRLGIAQGDPVRVTSRRGSTVAPARLTESIRLDTAFMPFHWPGTNDVTSTALDPVSRMPEFKVCAVRLERAA